MPAWLRALFAASPPVPAPDPRDWLEALSLPVFDGLTGAERDVLRQLGCRLLADKAVNAAGDAQPTGYDIAAVAAQAVLPVLNLGYDWLTGWNEIILYPRQFVPEREVTDDFGVVHHVREPMSGEAWLGGPLVLSLDDVAESGHCQGYNVVIHEFAHKLDMRDGVVDGLPPLHADMPVAAWARVFTAAYEDFCRRVDDGQEELDIDPYASDSPAEFFAVLSEYFFELPALLHAQYPAVYAQMKAFYRQDPRRRLAGPA